MATQAELKIKDEESKQRVASGDVSRQMRDNMNTALRNASSSAEKKQIRDQFKVDTNKASDQTDNQQGANEDSNQRGDDDFTPKFNNVENDGSGGGSGLPEYPGEEPSPVAVNTPLIWDDQNEEARWLVGDPASPTDPNVYFDVFGYDPNPSTDGYSLLRTEFLEVIMCKDGAPVTGNIFFVENPVQP